MINTRNKFNIGKLFYNDKFVIVFSVFLAVIMWGFAVSTGQETSYLTIDDIPVSLPELSDDLRVFGADNVTASVRVSGNALVIQSMSANDIFITASNTDELTEIGKKTMKLTAKKSGVKTDYEFASTVSPSSIDVYVDRYVSREITITDSIQVDNIDSSVYRSQNVLSQQTVTVQGAESFVNKIAEVRAEDEVTETLSSTKKLTDVPLVFYDANGQTVETTYLNFNITTVDVTIPVYKVQELEISPNIINMPEDFNFDLSRIKVNPQKVNVAFLDETNSYNIESISTEEIDFSKLTFANNKFKTKLIIPSGCKDINAISDVEVEFDMSGLKTKTLNVNKFQVIGQTSGKKTTPLTKSKSITIIGPESEISSISAANVTAIVDMSESNASNSKYSEETLKFVINSKFSGCWVYGTYKIDVETSDSSSQESSENSE